MLKMTTNLRNTIYVENEMQDIVKEFYLLNQNLIKFPKRTSSISFDRARTITRTFDRGFVRAEYNDLNFCRLLLLFWRGKMIMTFLLYSWKKMMMNFLLVDRTMMMNF